MNSPATVKKISKKSDLSECFNLELIKTNQKMTAKSRHNNKLDFGFKNKDFKL